MKTFKKAVLSLFSLSIFAISLYAFSAQAASYSFNIHTQVTGSTTHSFNNASTRTTVTAGSYLQSTGTTPTSSPLNYRVRLENTRWVGGTSYNTSSITANNRSYTRSFGTIDSGNYRINVALVKGTTSFVGYAIGSGSISQ